MEHKEKKPAVKKPAVKKAASSKPAAAKEKYIEAVGRRKTSVARVRMFVRKAEGKGYDAVVNEKPYAKYFPLERQRRTALAAFAATEENFPITVLVKGGGINSQADAVRLGLARALIKMKEDYRGKLKALGYLTRDSRMVERKKYGLKKARRAPQWAKR